MKYFLKSDTELRIIEKNKLKRIQRRIYSDFTKLSLVFIVTGELYFGRFALKYPTVSII